MLAPPFTRLARRALSTWGASTRRLQVIDCHAAGEPARVVVGGLPTVPGATIAEKRSHMMRHMDSLRKLLLLEPRGYPCQNANYILPPTHPDAAFGFVIAEQNAIYPMMSGHNAICVATALLETGMVPMEEPYTRFALEAPAGLIPIEAECRHGRVLGVTLRNQPAFCRAQDMDLRIDVRTLGEVRVSVAYGGMWYCIVDAESVGLCLEPAHGREIEFAEKSPCRYPATGLYAQSLPPALAQPHHSIPLGTGEGTAPAPAPEDYAYKDRLGKMGEQSGR